jgi:hypothetical protein
VRDINKTFLPTPYTIFLTKQVNIPNRIDVLYTLLSKFGKRLNSTFFEISPDIIKELFDLIDNEIYNNNIYENLTQDTYRIIQGDTEYIIPKMVEHEETIYSTPNISDMVNEIDTYDRLSRNNNYIDLDL